jgi:hypothetical protein
MQHKSLLVFSFFLSIFVTVGFAQSPALEIARVKYRGGGDWYNDPSSLRNLIRFANQQLPILLSERYRDVELGSSDLMMYPFVFLTGHGTIEVNEIEVENLRNYLLQGGFLYIDDDYGLDASARELMKRVFPSDSWVELPFTHNLYKIPFSFPKGAPKIHEHDNKPPQGFALFHNGKMVAFYTYESNPSDGWADPEIHNTPEALREKALQFGTNLLFFALTEVN